MSRCATCHYWRHGFCPIKLERTEPDDGCASWSGGTTDLPEVISLRPLPLLSAESHVKTPLEQLQHWWGKASEKERETFGVEYERWKAISPGNDARG